MTPPAIARPIVLICALSLALVLAFAYLGQEVREPATTTTDQHLLRRVLDGTRSWPLAIAKTASLVGTGPVVIGVAIVVGIFLARGRRWFDCALLIAAVVGATLLSPVTKYLVSRARPTAFFRTSASGYSFPSGHTLNSTCLALALGFIIWRLPWRRGTKIAASLALALYAVCVGASRVVLGVHYPTDVLGGFLLGAAWVTLLMAALLVAEHQRAARQPTRS